MRNKRIHIHAYINARQHTFESVYERILTKTEFVCVRINSMSIKTKIHMHRVREFDGNNKKNQSNQPSNKLYKMRPR